jgi:tetrapyrrole methylase family protein / MazG family protein
MSGIILLGLGPGDPNQLTREAVEVLGLADEIWLRTRQHPTVAALPGTLDIHSFDHLYEKGETFESVYDHIVEEVLKLGRRTEGVVYAVPGHPFVAEITCRKIFEFARAEGLDVRVVSGLSFLEPTFAALGFDPFPQIILFDAMELSMTHIPAFPPDLPVLVAQIYSGLVASETKTTLNTIYPDEHVVYLIHGAGTRNEIVEELPLFEIDRTEHFGLLTSLYVPPTQPGTSLESFQEIVARLRAPDGCPWDREQTHLSLRTHLLEETYEALEAIDSEKVEDMREEFGDLLLQIVLHAQIAAEEGEFTMNDVIKHIYDKIVRRHPHVFGEVQLDGVAGVLQNWERLKEQERKEKKEKKGLLDGVPLAFPALSQAQEYQDRAARVGFDWPVIEGVLDKIGEEVLEIKAASNQDQIVEEIGDLLFVLVNLARWKDVDAESALRTANIKFKTRFGFIEQGAQKQGKSLSDMTLAQMDELWDQAKGREEG